MHSQHVFVFYVVVTVVTLFTLNNLISEEGQYAGFRQTLENLENLEKQSTLKKIFFSSATLGNSGIFFQDSDWNLLA